jgi:hypothetical protein
MPEKTVSAVLSSEPLYQFALSACDTQCTQNCPFPHHSILPRSNPKSSTDRVLWGMFHCLRSIVSMVRKVI